MNLNELIYQVARPLGGLKLANFITRKHPRILMYHRVHPSGSKDGIDVETFREQMGLIRRSFHVMTLGQLLQASNDGGVPDNAVVITFDDGYHDFLDNAFPVLQEFDLKATLFVTTGFVSRELWLWPDQIRYALDSSSCEKLHLPGPFEAQDLLKGGKEPAWHAVADYCLTLPNVEKLDLINRLFEQLNVIKPDSAPEHYRALEWKEIRKLVSSGIEVGSHSHSHPILTRLTKQELTHELVHSGDVIREELGHFPDFFCYPNGQEIDFDDRVKAEVDEAGYKYAVAAFPSADPLADRWAIKRYPASESRNTMEKLMYGLSYFRL